MVSGVHRKSRRYRSASTRTHFSWLRFGAAYNSGIREATYFYSLPERSKLRTKMTRAPCRRRTGEAVPRAEKFGDLITADHRVLDEEGESRNNHRYAVVVPDLATQWIQSYPCKTNFSGDGKEFTKVSRADGKAKKSLIPTIRWNLANPVKICHGII